MDINTLLLIFLVLGVAFLAYKKFTPSNESKKIENTPKSKDLSIENVGAEGVLTLEGVKNGVENLDLVVSAKHLYKNEDYEWYELIADGGEGSYSIEIENDDGLKIRLSQKSLKLRDLNLNKDQLFEMAEKEEGEVSFEDKQYFFDEKGDYFFHRDCNLEKGEPFSLIEFIASDQKSFLTIEIWKGGETEVTQSISIDPDCVKIYSLGKNL